MKAEGLDYFSLHLGSESGLGTSKRWSREASTTLILLFAVAMGEGVESGAGISKVSDLHGHLPMSHRKIAPTGPVQAWTLVFWVKNRRKRRGRALLGRPKPSQHLDGAQMK